MSLRRAFTCSVGILSVITFVLSITCIIKGLLSNGASCETVLPGFYIRIGLPLLVVSVIGLIGACFGITYFLWLYQCAALVLFIGLIIFSILAWSAIRYGEAGEPTRHDVHQMNHFSHTLQQFLERNWEGYKKCLVVIDVCKFDDSKLAVPDQNKKFMESNRMQWACCIPPLNCGYGHKNFSDWIVPKSKRISEGKHEPDCYLWNTRKDARCYDCNKCKASFLFNLREKFKVFLFTDLGLIIAFIIINLSIGICAFKSNKSADRYMKYREEQVKIACDNTIFPQP